MSLKNISKQVAVEFLLKKKSGKSNPDNLYVLSYNSIILRIIITNVINYLVNRLFSKFHLWSMVNKLIIYKISCFGLFYLSRRKSRNKWYFVTRYLSEENVIKVR